MAIDPFSNHNPSDPDRSSLPIPAGSMGRLNDEQIAKALDWAERPRKRRWWDRLFQWLNTKFTRKDWSG